MTKIGPKETALKSKRAEIMDRIPPFLKRTEDKRAKTKTKPDIDPGVTLAPPLAIQKAIAKDLKDDTVIEAKAELVQTVYDRLGDIASPPPPQPTEAKVVTVDPPGEPAQKKTKKLPRALQKALAEKEKLNQPKHSAEANPMETTVKKSAKKTTTKKIVTPRQNGAAAKAFTETNVETAIKMIKRKDGAKSSELQKACKWAPVMVRRFVRDVGRKKLKMNIVCERDGMDSVYKIE